MTAIIEIQFIIVCIYFANAAKTFIYDVDVYVCYRTSAQLKNFEKLFKWYCLKYLDWAYKMGRYFHEIQQKQSKRKAVTQRCSVKKLFLEIPSGMVGRGVMRVWCAIFIVVWMIRSGMLKTRFWTGDSFLSFFHYSYLHLNFLAYVHKYNTNLHRLN